MKIARVIHEKKFIIAGDRFEGNFKQHAYAGYGIKPSKIRDGNEFQVVFTSRIAWDNGSNIDYESIAANIIPYDIQLTLPLLIYVAKDSMEKIKERWLSHPDYSKLNLPPGFFVEMGEKDIENIEIVLDNHLLKSQL